MHFLLTALGSYGDVHPMVGLGTALAARGHEVVVVANPHFARMIEGAGLAFEAVSTDEAYNRLTQHPDLWSPRRSVEVVFRWGVDALIDELYDAVARLYRPGETVIGAHGLDLASRVATESLGARVVSIVYAPFALWSDRSPPRLPWGPSGPRWLVRCLARVGESLFERRLLRPPIDRLRRRVGLAPIDERFLSWCYRVAPPLCLFPSWFAGDPGDWPRGTITTGFPLWDGGDEGGVAGEVADFLDAGPPPVAFTPGSANRDAARFFAAAIDACGRLGRRGLLLTKYAEQIPSRLPDGVGWFGFVPLSSVLPRTAALVHHGGIGTTAQGLLAGTPQLVQPLAFDQRDNAARVRRLGVAAELPPSRFTGPRLAEVLGGLLSDAGVRERSREIASRCDPRAWREAACDALEEAGDAVRMSAAL